MSAHDQPLEPAPADGVEILRISVILRPDGALRTGCNARFDGLSTRQVAQAMAALHHGASALGVAFAGDLESAGNAPAVKTYLAAFAEALGQMDGAAPNTAVLAHVGAYSEAGPLPEAVLRQLASVRAQHGCDFAPPLPPPPPPSEGGPA